MGGGSSVWVDFLAKMAYAIPYVVYIQTKKAKESKITRLYKAPTYYCG
jgi:hypothetical protein